MSELHYSVFRYSPLITEGEKFSVVLGILFSSPSEHYCTFQINENLSYHNLCFYGIEEQCITKLLYAIKGEVEEAHPEQFDIEEYIRFYINDFCFDKVRTAPLGAIDVVVKNICKSHFE